MTISLKRCLVGMMTIAIVSGCASAGEKSTSDSGNIRLEENDVVWTTHSNIARDSMPTGNGDIGINVWTEENGDLLVYLGKTDAFDAQCRLLKLGRVRIHFSGEPFAMFPSLSATVRLLPSAPGARFSCRAAGALPAPSTVQASVRRWMAATGHRLPAS